MPQATPFHACYEALLAGERPWEADESPTAAGQRASEKANAAPRAQYMLELLSKPVEHSVIVDLLANVSPNELMDDRYARRRDNITGLWKEALRVWTESSNLHDELVCHAIDTILALACALLPKAYTNYTLDVITLLAGRMDEADDMFYALMTAIERTCRRPQIDTHNSDDVFTHAPSPPSSSAVIAHQQHSALRLVIVLTACTGSTSLTTYLLHRDLFAAAMHVAQTTGASNEHVLCDVALCTALLATAGHAHGTTHATGLGRDPVSSAFMNHVAFQPYQRRMRDYAHLHDLKRIAHACSARAMHILAAYTHDEHAATHQSRSRVWGLDWMYMDSRKNLWSAATALSPTASAAASDTAPARPPPHAWLFFALWVWVHSNTRFHACVVDAESQGGEPPLIVSFLSVTSFLLTHAAISARATMYAHTALQIMLVLLGRTDAQAPMQAVTMRLLLDEDSLESPAARWCWQVVQCRDKPGALPPTPKTGTKRPRRLATCCVNNVAIFLKYNRSKHLDAASFRTALMVIQRIVLLCAQNKLLLEYDWLEAWRAILATADFIAARQTEISDDTHQLAECLIETMAVVLVYSDKFLQTPAETHWLLYELARSKHTIEKLMPITGTSSTARQVHGVLLCEILDAIDADMAKEHDKARSARSWLFFQRNSANEPVSMHTILSIIQHLDLPTLLASDKPACAAVARAALTASSGRSPGGVPSPSASLLRIIQHDWLAS